MTTAVATKESTALAPRVTGDQLELVKRTVANGATDAELKLYLYDCERQGVHPLDRLLHFTKRGGKYTPVTSIDLMRIRAAETGEYAGSDDAAFEETINGVVNHATVTVWRLVQGTRCAFTATARWSEYFPGDAGGHMWKKMPHTMLAKCAEALALRKGFPRQLAGLYAKEEMEQAESTYSVESLSNSETRARPIAASSNGRTSDLGSGDAGSSPAAAAIDNGPDLLADAPANAHLITKISKVPTRNPRVSRYELVIQGESDDWPGTSITASTINERLAALAEQVCQNRTPVRVSVTKSKFGMDIDAIAPFEHDSRMDDHSAPLTDDDIPF